MITRLFVRNVSVHPGFGSLIAEYAEMADKRMGEPSYDEANYLPLEEKGLLEVFCAIRNGLMVGICVCLQGRIPRFNYTIGIVESLYLMRGYRHTGEGHRLIDAAEDFARIRALPEVFINVHHQYIPTLGKLLTRRGYMPRLHTYGKMV